jgi:hypothetical protein
MPLAPDPQASPEPRVSPLAVLLVLLSLKLGERGMGRATSLQQALLPALLRALLAQPASPSAGFPRAVVFLSALSRLASGISIAVSLTLQN